MKRPVLIQDGFWIEARCPDCLGTLLYDDDDDEPMASCDDCTYMIDLPPVDGSYYIPRIPARLDRELSIRLWAAAWLDVSVETVKVNFS